MGVIKCSKNTFLCSGVLWLLISLGGLSFFLWAWFGGSGIYRVPSDNVYIGLVGLFGLWTIVSLAGVIARVIHGEGLLIFFIIMSFLMTLATILGGIFVLLYMNDVSTFEGLDSSASSAADSVENDFFVWAADNAAEWVEAQDTLQCCGYDFEALYNEDVDLATGEACNATLLASLEAECPTYSESCAETAMDTYNLDADYFCIDAIAVFFQEQTPYIGVGIGLMVLLQLVAWISAMRMYWVPYELGGFYDGAEDEGLPTKAGDMGSMPTANPVASPFGSDDDGPPMGGSSFGGPRPPPMSNFGQNIRNMGNRMSTRVPAMFGGGAPGGSQVGAFTGGPPPSGAPPLGGGAPPPGPPPGMGGFRGAMNRVSMRMGFGGGRPPAGPPPGFGGGSGGGAGPMGGGPMGGGPPPLGGGGGSSGGGPPPSSGPPRGGMGMELPQPNSGLGGGAPPPSGGGFGAKMKGFGNRVSMKFAGMAPFGGRGGPPGPPPGAGFGGAPPRGPPSGGGGFGGPPRGPPAPSPAPAPSRGGPPAPNRGKGKKAAARPPMGGGGGGRGGLLAQIQQGTRLNRSDMNDRSGPALQGRALD